MSGELAPRPPPLHTLNAVRVIAEYLVVRFHCLPNHHYLSDAVEVGPIGEDIMSFFFVLSGFVCMYSARDRDLFTLQSRIRYGFQKIKRLYPIFLLNYLCSLPVTILVSMPRMQYCWAGYVCAPLQLFFLDAWAGCGFRFTVLGVAWFISSSVWLWIAFPFFKDFLAERVFNGDRIWAKMGAINLIWGFLCLLLYKHDLYTIAPLPLVRAGEFLIGCGTACALHTEPPWVLANGRHLLLGCLVFAVYCLQLSKHNMEFLCMHEAYQHEECTLWHAGQTWVPASPPCITVFEKVVNKYALVWAGVIHGLARAELDGKKDGFFMRILHAELFKTLNKFALTLYLSHLSIGFAYRWLGEQLFGIPREEWRDDQLLILIYLSSYGVHYGLLRVVQWAESKQNQPETLPDAEPLVEKS
jgi:hypothetical protein